MRSVVLTQHLPHLTLLGSILNRVHLENENYVILIKIDYISSWEQLPHFHAEEAWNPLIGHHEHHMSLRYFFVPKLKFRLNWYILPDTHSKMLYGWFQGCLQFWMKIYSNFIWRKYAWAGRLQTLFSVSWNLK